MFLLKILWSCDHTNDKSQSGHRYHRNVVDSLNAFWDCLYPVGLYQRAIIWGQYCLSLMFVSLCILVNIIVSLISWIRNNPWNEDIVYLFLSWHMIWAVFFFVVFVFSQRNFLGRANWKVLPENSEKPKFYKFFMGDFFFFFPFFSSNGCQIFPEN